MPVARALGWVNTRVLLRLVFYLVLAPLGIAMRLAGRDALRLKFDPARDHVRCDPPAAPGDHMRRLF